MASREGPQGIGLALPQQGGQAQADARATAYSQAGMRAEALEAAKEAVALRRALAKENPQAFMPNLARTLSTYGDVLIASGRVEESIAAYQECAQLLRPFMEAMPDAFGGLFNANLRDMIKALRAKGVSEAEIVALLQKLGVEPGDGGGPPPEVALFQTWAQAHNEGRSAQAQAVYADLLAALDAAPDDRSLNPIRNAVAHARDQLGDAWPYGDLPK